MTRIVAGRFWCLVAASLLAGCATGQTTASSPEKVVRIPTFAPCENLDGRVEGIASGAEGKKLYANLGTVVRILDVEDGRCVGEVRGDAFPLYYELAAGYLLFGTPEQILVYSVEEKRVVREIARPRYDCEDPGGCPEEDFGFLELSPDGRWMVVRSKRDGSFYVYDLSTGKLTNKVDENARSPTFASDSSQLFYVTESPFAVKMYDIASQTSTVLLKTLRRGMFGTRRDNSVSALRALPSGRLMIASGSGSLVLWQPGEDLQGLNGIEDGNGGALISNNGRLIAAVADRTWYFKSKDLFESAEGEPDFISPYWNEFEVNEPGKFLHVALSPNGRRFAWASKSDITVYDVETYRKEKKPLAEFRGGEVESNEYERIAERMAEFRARPVPRKPSSTPPSTSSSSTSTPTSTTTTTTTSTTPPSEPKQGETRGPVLSLPRRAGHEHRGGLGQGLGGAPRKAPEVLGNHPKEPIRRRMRLAVRGKRRRHRRGWDGALRKRPLALSPHGPLQGRRIVFVVGSRRGTGISITELTATLRSSTPRFTIWSARSSASSRWPRPRQPMNGSYYSSVIALPLSAT